MIRLWVEFQNKIVENGTISMKRTSLWWFFFLLRVLQQKRKWKNRLCLLSASLCRPVEGVFRRTRLWMKQGVCPWSWRETGGQVWPKPSRTNSTFTSRAGRSPAAGNAGWKPKTEPRERPCSSNQTRVSGPDRGRVLRIEDQTRQMCQKNSEFVTAKSSVRSGNLSVIVSFKGGRSLNFLFYSSIFFK